jgi:hypothetical protein
VLVVVVVVLVIVGTRPSSRNDTTPKTTAAGHRHHHHRAKHHAKKVVHRAPPKPKPKSVSLSMTATGTVYVCLVNGAGKVLIPGQTFQSGQAIPTKVAKSLLLTLGNASVTVKADGVSVPVQASANAIGLKFTPTGHTTLPAAREPTCAP